MARLPKRPFPWIAGVAAIVVAAIGLGGLLVAATGAYNVAASAGHWWITDRLLAFGMRRSVALRAHVIDVPPLDDVNLYRLGAAHFHGGCAFCHGAPGIRISPVAEHMLPPPPPLTETGDHWNDRELFWIVKHGIKYTGMPAWAAQQRDDEVWALIAFLKRLPQLDARAYRELAIGDLPVPRQTGGEIATQETQEDAVSACARCHGAAGRGPPSNLVPVLHGQPAEYLAAALRAYASGARASGVMQPVAADLAEDAIAKVTAYYARLGQPPAADRAAVDADAIERGRAIATDGVAEARIPPCASCHGAGALPDYPRLAGQSARYLANQLRLWRAGVAPQTEAAAIMAPVAQLLTDRQITDVSAYWSSIAPAARTP